MKFKHICMFFVFLALIIDSSKSYAVCEYGPDTCLPGFVWREACGPNDHVCVPGASRDQAATDNSLADQRRSPTGGPYGADTCLQGFVWREACPGDHVCVLGSTRTQAAVENAQANARRDPQCAQSPTPPRSDTSAPGFIQNSIKFQRITDGMEVGSAIVPAGGITFSPIENNRRFIIAASAGDMESGIANIHLNGEIKWTCTQPLGNISQLSQGTLSAISDEEKNNSSTSGNPHLRSAHFTVDPFENNPLRRVCSCDANTSELTVNIRLVATNGAGLTTSSDPITVVYAPQQPCPQPLNAVCGNPERGQVFPCVEGTSCKPKTSKVCEGWWIFKTCDYIRTVDSFCLP